MEQSDNIWALVDEARKLLRADWRLKENVDYAITVKYGQVHVLCNAVFEDSIRQAFRQIQVEICSLHTYR